MQLKCRICGCLFLNHQNVLWWTVNWIALNRRHRYWQGRVLEVTLVTSDWQTPSMQAIDYILRARGSGIHGNMEDGSQESSRHTATKLECTGCSLMLPQWQTTNCKNTVTAKPLMRDASKYHRKIGHLKQVVTLWRCIWPEPVQNWGWSLKEVY